MGLGRALYRLALRASSLLSGASWTPSTFTGTGATNPWHSLDRQRLVVDPLKWVNGTANQVIAKNLRHLAAQLRHLERNNPLLRAIIEGHKAERIGTGITVIPATPDEVLNQELTQVWDDYRHAIGAGGESDLELQRMFCAEDDLAGNALGRIVHIPSRTADGLCPYAVMPLDVDWLSDTQVGPIADDHLYVDGIECDRYCAPVAYHIRDPEDDANAERVPARMMLHYYERRRPRQCLGIPGAVAIIERLTQYARLQDAELASAIRASLWTAVVTSGAGESMPAADDTDPGSGSSDERDILDVPPGAMVELGTGEDMKIFQPNRPNTDVAVFCSHMLGDMAAGAIISRTFLDRDGSKMNHSNSRFDAIKSNVLTKPWQMQFGAATVGRYYQLAVPHMMAAIGRAWPVDPRAQRTLQRYRLQPDVAPEHDALAVEKAAEIAQRNGTFTFESYFGAKGLDWRTVMAQRAVEDEFLRGLGLEIVRADTASDEPEDEEEEEDAA